MKQQPQQNAGVKAAIEEIQRRNAPTSRSLNLMLLDFLRGKKVSQQNNTDEPTDQTGEKENETTNN